jgi:hypothetical protein
MLAIDLPTQTQWSKIIYTPFFGGIAAAYSMHMDKEASFQQAKIRTMGSIFGGLYGMIILILSEAIFTQAFNIDTTSILYYLLDYLLVAAAIIILIHITVVTHKTYATWIACLTYLSVTVSIRNDFDEQLFGFFSDDAMINSYLVAIVFALNRIFSTVVGVGISLFVNLFVLPRQKNKKVLFVSSLDMAILNKDHRISGFTKYKINQLCRSGCKLTFATTRTQASLNEIFSGIKLNMPLITMNGSAIYNPKDRKYMSVDNIPHDVRIKLESIFAERKVNYFCYSVDDDVLQIYHGKIKNDGELKYYKDGRNEYFDNYVRGAVPEDMEACFYVLIDKKQEIMSIVDKINAEGIGKELDLLWYEFEIDGYYFLKINSKNSNKYTRLQELKEQTGAEKLVVFGSGSSDIEMMRMADISLCLKSANDKVKNEATIVLNTDNPDEILKTIEKIYHKKDFDKYKQKLLAKQN